MSRRRVALLIESSRSYGRDLLRGIARYSRTRSDWSLLHEEGTIDAKMPDWLQDSPVDGVIARVDSHTVRPLQRLGVPIVDVRCRRRFDGIPQVDTDDTDVARLAFDHLWQRGFRRFAFCGYRAVYYSETRLRRFRELAEDAGCPITVYESPGRRADPVSNIERSALLDSNPLANWLRELEAPTGLFVCNDIRGQQVLNVCRSLDISIPDDLGVVGVDDDDAICPLCDPPLSSVQPNAEQVGYAAAEHLDRAMNGARVSAETLFVPPNTVTQRLSTQVIAVEDRELARVCRYIRENAYRGIDVSDVVRFTTLSRRQLERRFREALDTTPHEEITSVRVARVKQLLVDTPLPLEEIAPLAGYSHRESLSAVFRRETGETPGAYRKRLAT
ncbi:MAG: DNA-binding transcriptional regulator [Planctomycetota bacterium]